MHELAALLGLALSAGAAHSSPAWLHDAELRAVARAAVPPAPLASPAATYEAAVPPACSGDVCQPQVALPGYKPRFTARTSRAQVTVKALDAAGLEPVASVAWWLAGTGLRFEYTSAAMDAAANGGTLGLGYYQVVLGCRIDAFGGVALAQRGR